MAITLENTGVAGTDAAQPAVESFDQMVNRVSLWMALPAGLLVALLVVLLNLNRNPIPFGADLRSFAMIAFLAMFPIALVTAGVAYVLGVRAWNARVGAERHRTWHWPLVPVSLAYMLFACGISILLLALVEFAFRELALSRLQAALLMGLGMAAAVPAIVDSAMRVNTGRLLTLILVLLGSGVYLTAATINDPLWWRISFSYLGKLQSNVNYIFNGTLIFSGILLLIWTSYLMSDYRILVRHGVAAERWAPWVRGAMIWLGVGVMLVGFFKSNLTPFSALMHNLAAYSLAGLFFVLMLTPRWLVPGFPRVFHTLSLALVIVLAGVLAGRAMGTVNTVGLEIVAFALGLMWLSQFARNTESIAARLEPDAFAR